MTLTNGKFLLDTNIVIALMEGEGAILSNLDLAPEVFIPAENTAKIERFAAGRAIVSCDLDVAREYGRLRQRLKKKGRPLPENDIWIAAAAIHHGMVLVTRDGHFNDIEELTTTTWSIQPQ